MSFSSKDLVHTRYIFSGVGVTSFCCPQHCSFLFLCGFYSYSVAICSRWCPVVYCTLRSYPLQQGLPISHKSDDIQPKFPLTRSVFPHVPAPLPCVLTIFLCQATTTKHTDFSRIQKDAHETRPLLPCRTFLLVEVSYLGFRRRSANDATHITFTVYSAKKKLGR